MKNKMSNTGMILWQIYFDFMYDLTKHHLAAWEYFFHERIKKAQSLKSRSYCLALWQHPLKGRKTYKIETILRLGKKRYHWTLCLWSWLKKTCKEIVTYHCMPGWLQACNFLHTCYVFPKKACKCYMCNLKKALLIKRHHRKLKISWKIEKVMPN